MRWTPTQKLREHVSPLLGRDPGRIEATWQFLYRGAYWRRVLIGMVAIGAVDMARWDILGKRTGPPVARGTGARSIGRHRHAFRWDVPALLEQVDTHR